MNLNDSEFERELGALRPAAPPPALCEAIGRELATRDATKRVRVAAAAVWPRRAAMPAVLRAFGWAGAGACAALATITILERDGTRPAPEQVIAAAEAGPVFARAESSAEFIAAADEGFVFAEDTPPARQVRYSSIERHVWTDAATGARLEIEIPREDVRLVPVALQ